MEPRLHGRCLLCTVSSDEFTQKLVQVHQRPRTSITIICTLFSDNNNDLYYLNRVRNTSPESRDRFLKLVCIIIRTKQFF